MGNDTNEDKLQKAMQYLKERGIWVLDGRFKPTKPVDTDISKTIARYRSQVQGKQPVRGVR